MPRPRKRDLTQAQFDAKLAKHGMRYAVMGYVHITESTMVCRFNAGERLRDQFNYLLREQKRALAKSIPTT